jgi:hypothetical protein
MLPEIHSIQATSDSGHTHSLVEVVHPTTRLTIVLEWLAMWTHAEP